MNRGTIVQQGSVATITASVSSQGKGCMVTFTTSSLAADVLALLPPTAAPLTGQGGFQINLDSESKITALIDVLRQQRVDIYGIQQAKIDLEDAFIELIKSPPATGMSP